MENGFSAEQSGSRQLVVVNHSPLLATLMITAVIGVAVCIASMFYLHQQMTRVERELRMQQAWSLSLHATLVEAGLMEPEAAALLTNPSRED